MSSPEAIRVGPGFTAEFPGAVASSAEAAANLVRAAEDVLTEIQRRRSAVAPLSASAFEALAVIEGAGEPLPSHVIAERLIVSTASMTSLLDTLERRGLAARLPHPTDRRKILVDVTNEGRRIVDHMLPVVHATATEAFSVLTEKERQLLIELLTRLRRQVSPMAAGEPIPPKPRRKPKQA
jgi:DNA-binding MarR family transcriptional regulator